MVGTNRRNINRPEPGHKNGDNKMSTIAATPTIEIFAAFTKWINQRPGLEQGNYRTSPTHRGDDGLGAYRAEQRTIANQKKRALKALEAAQNFPFDAAAMTEALERSFSGRLSWVGVKTKTIEKGRIPVEGTRAEFSYCTGQYFPTEYRIAAAVVLEAYVHSVTPKVLPAEGTRFNSIKDIERASLASGSHWFSKDNMKAFRTRLESEVIPAPDGKILFVTSEQDWNGERMFTVRSFDPTDASIDTAGEYHSHTTKGEAFKAAMKIAGKI
jgi:hypothetical protein